MYDSRTRISRELLSSLRTRYQDSCFQTIIRSNITLKESTGFGVPITHYRASRGFYDYRSLANEVLGNDATQKTIEIDAIQNYLAPRRIGGGVLFSYLDPDANHVVIEGDFNSWDGTNDMLLDVDGHGLWQRVISLKPGHYKYRFIADGRPAADPNNAQTEIVEGKGVVSVAEV
jgi:hypothetical protein